MDMMEFIRPELLILIPALYFVGMGIKKSAIKDHYIPLILGLTGIFLSALYVVSASEIAGIQDLSAAIFAAVTQGILCAGVSVYANQLFKQRKGD